MSIATQQHLERLLQITFDADPDPVVAQLLDQAQREVEMWCLRPAGFDEDEVTRTFDPGGRRFLRLPLYPIQAVASVTEHGNVLTVDEDYVVYEDGRLMRTAGDPNRTSRWSRLRRSVSVTWTGGYSDLTVGFEPPADLIGVVCSVAGRRFKAAAAYASSDGPGDVQQVQLAGVGTISYRGASPLTLMQGLAGTSGGDAPGLVPQEILVASAYRSYRMAGGSF